MAPAPHHNFLSVLLFASRNVLLSLTVGPLHVLGLRRRIHVCHMRRRIHVCHMTLHVCVGTGLDDRLDFVAQMIEAGIVAASCSLDPLGNLAC